MLGGRGQDAGQIIGDDLADIAAFAVAPARGLDRVKHIAGGIEGRIRQPSILIDDRPAGARIERQMRRADKLRGRDELAGEQHAIASDGLQPAALVREPHRGDARLRPSMAMSFVS